MEETFLGEAVSLAPGWDSAETRFSAVVGASLRKKRHTSRRHMRLVPSLWMPVQNTLSQRIGQVPPLESQSWEVRHFSFLFITDNQKTVKIVSGLFVKRLCSTLNQKDLGFRRPNTVCETGVWFSPTGLTGSGLSYIHMTETRAAGVCTCWDCMAAPMAYFKGLPVLLIYEKQLRAQAE